MLEKNVKINDKMYSIVSDDNYLDAVGENFEPHMVQLYRALVCKHDVVADIGANIGLTALLFSSLASKVFSFEPSPSTYKILETNLARAGVTNVKAINLGLGEKPESLMITFAKNNRSGAFVSNSKIRPIRGHITEEIQIDTIDNYFSKLEIMPNFIKIDVEGFEISVIKGATKILSKSKPIVVMEMNHFCLNVLHRITLPDFLEFICTVFPVCYAIDTDNQSIADLHDSDEAYHVMHEHVVRHRYPNLVCCFDYSVKDKLYSLKNFISQDKIVTNVAQFADLLKAARCYIQKRLDVKELYPLTAENAGCLDKGYGGYEKPAPNYNWTTQGGWLGIWGNENQIGVGVTGFFEEIKPVIEKYRPNAKEIFFPYPTKYDVNQKIEPNTKGQLLMVFEKGFVLS